MSYPNTLDRNIPALDSRNLDADAKKISARPGVFFLHKEAGMTSFQAIKHLQKMHCVQKVGHCGTLDRFAEGLLIVLSNGATKLAEALTGLDKHYRAEVLFGTETETLDPEGTVVRTAEVPPADGIFLQNCLKDWLVEIASNSACIWQAPPKFSAIHKDGKRLYQRALAGEELTDLPLRSVQLYSCEFIAWQPPVLTLDIHCSKGFYVRSFARDLGKRCGSAAHLKSLVRTAISGIQLSEARKLGEAPSWHEPASLLRRLDTGLKIWELGEVLQGASKQQVEQFWKDLKRGLLAKPLRQFAHPDFSSAEQGQNRSTSQEIALLDGQQLLALLRYEQRQLRFWHNFIAAQQN